MISASTILTDQLLVMYASQTGNAEWIAKSIDSEALKRGYKSQCYVMDSYEEAQIEQKSVVILVSSTTGDGDAPDNALKWWRYYRKLSKSNPRAFEHLSIAVLGIGDTNYNNFGAHPKKLEKKLIELGASSFYPILIADEVEGLESQIDPWIAGLWHPLSQIVSNSPSSVSRAVSQPEVVIQKGLESLQVEDLQFAYKLPLNFDLPNELPGVGFSPVPKCKISFSNGKVIDFFNPWLSHGEALEYSQKHPYGASIASGRCLTSEGAVKRTLELQFDITGMKWNYRPGDAIGLFAPNKRELVDGILKCLGVQRTLSVCIEPASDGEEAKMLVPSHLPSSCTASDLLTYYVDIVGFPRKSFLRCLADYATDLTQKKQLMYLCSRQGSQDLKQLMAYSPSTLDFLVTFSSAKVPLSVLVDNLAQLQPRYYSACSYHAKENGQVLINVAFNVVDYNVQLGESVQARRFGVCTPYLDMLCGKLTARDHQATQFQSMQQLSKVPVFPRPSKDFIAPPASTTMIMIGAGTGVAPYLGFLQQRQSQEPKQRSWLIYGCREVDKDFLFKEEITQFVLDGTLSKCSVAVSRQTPPASSEIEYGGKYVQDILKTQGHTLIDWMLNHNASIFVCGDARNMAKQVQSTVIEMLQVHGALGQAEALMTFSSWLKSNRYVRDVWN